MSQQDLNSIVGELVESERTCNEQRKIYTALENVLIRKEYLQNLELAPFSDEKKVTGSPTPNSSNHSLNKNKSLTKVKSNSNVKGHKLRNSLNNDFLVVQKQIHQFESYKNCIDHLSNKYSVEFLNVLSSQV